MRRFYEGVLCGMIMAAILGSMVAYAATVQLDITYTDFQLKALQHHFSPGRTNAGVKILATPAQVKAALENQVQEFITSKTVEYRGARLQNKMAVDMSAVDTWVDVNCPDLQ